MKRVHAAGAALALGLGAPACGPPPDEPAGRVVEALGAAELVDVYVVLDGPSAIEILGPGADFGAPEAVKRTRQRLVELAVERDALRPALLALGGVIIDELARVSNAFHVQLPLAVLDKARSLPGVLRVEPVPLHTHALHSALPVVGAPALWASGSPFHGEGMRIGILDTGVDYLHADFGGAGDPAAFEADDPTIIEPGTFPTARVIGGFDFAGNDYNPNGGDATPAPDDDPIDCNSHGTHVGGIAAGGGVLGDGTAYAGPYDQSFSPTAFRVAPGVAPQALLYALKVFGCGGGTRLVASGLERASDPDEDGDMSDRLDVVNASLGSPYGTPNVAQDQAIDNYTAVGGLFVASAGNEGGTFFVTGSPATARSSLSVAASIDNTFIALEVTSPVGLVGHYAATEAGFSEPLAATGPVAGEIARAMPALGCGPLDNAAEMAGHIALIDRGDCTFYDKFVHAEAAGAIAVVVANNNFDDPFIMGGSGETSPLPGVMIGLLDGDLVKAALPSGVSVVLSTAPFAGDGAELVAGLSSRGPSVVENLLKPEIAAPGVAIDSAGMGSGIDPASKQGTSMAAPFVSGAAALVRQAHPSLAPAEVKAQLMNTSTLLFDREGDPFPVSMQGSGRLDIVRAVSQQVRANVLGEEGEVGVSFGAIVSAVATSVEREIAVANHGDESVSYAVSAPQVHPLHGATVTVAPTELTLGPGEAATLTLTLTIDPVLVGSPAADPVTPLFQSSLPRQFLNEADGHVILVDQGGQGQSLVVPYYGIVRAGAALHASSVQGCGLPEPGGDTPHPGPGGDTPHPGSGGEVVAVAVLGESAHPKPVVTAFELGALDPADPITTPEIATLDLRAVGVATDLATVSRFEEATVHFGLAVEGEWTTPAQGGYSLVGIAVDSDLDGDPDRMIVVEPLNDSEPFVDVLASRTYDITTCNNLAGDGCPAVGSKRYVNLVPANVADTSPFENSVLVLSAFAVDLGLSEESTALEYYAFTLGVLGVQEQTETAATDLALLRVDPARSAPDPGVPLYSLDQPVIVHLGPRDVNNHVGDLLLLHHHAEKGARFETVPVSVYGPDPLVISHTLPSSAPAHARLAGKVEVKNDGPTPVYGAVLQGSMEGPVVASFLAPSHGECDPSSESAIHCALGDIAPGETRSVTLELAAGDPGGATLKLAIVTAAGCSTPYDIPLQLGDGNSAPPALDVGGGCGCRVSGRTRLSPWLVALLAVVVRRRRRSRAACASSRGRSSEAAAPAPERWRNGLQSRGA